MARGLDHLVHAARDLDAAAALYRALRFTVGARNRIRFATRDLSRAPGHIAGAHRHRENWIIGL